jgi:hypothetical protein
VKDPESFVTEHLERAAKLTREQVSEHVRVWHGQEPDPRAPWQTHRTIHLYPDHEKKRKRFGDLWR